MSQNKLLHNFFIVKNMRSDRPRLDPRIRKGPHDARSAREEGRGVEKIAGWRKMPDQSAGGIGLVSDAFQGSAIANPYPLPPRFEAATAAQARNGPADRLCGCTHHGGQILLR